MKSVGGNGLSRLYYALGLCLLLAGSLALLALGLQAVSIALIDN